MNYLTRNKMRAILLCLIFLLCLNTNAAEQLQIKGKIKTLTSIKIKLTNLLGVEVFSASIDRNSGTFEMKPITIIPDLYILSIGKTKEDVFLTNNTVIVDGFYDDSNPGNSNLEFTGLEEHLKLMSCGLKKDDLIPADPALLAKFNGLQVSALAYHFARRKYDLMKPFFDRLSAKDVKTGSGTWLKKTMDSLLAFSTGVTAPDFEFPDKDGKLYSLKQFRGKIVVVDCWASWCLPCKKAMRKMMGFYDEFKGKVQFISVSVDETKADWLPSAEEEKIPWLSLWDKTGFKNREKSFMRTHYGFDAIPFIAIIDEKGTILKRDILDPALLKKYLIELTNSTNRNL
jgi:thiol-disulfide isomerase/thioredoxin